jgi:hypothetical protein
VPEDWQCAIIFPLWKKKDNKKDCNTYRGISLLSHSGKLYASIIEKRIRYIVGHNLVMHSLVFVKAEDVQMIFLHYVGRVKK